MPRAARSSSTARQAASLSPPMFLIASTTFCPSRRMPSAIRSEMAVALLSSRTLTTVPSRISRTMSSPARSRFCQASQAERVRCHARLTMSLPTLAGEQAAQRTAHPAGVHPGEIGLGDQSLGTMAEPLVGRQERALPFTLSRSIVQPGARHRQLQRAEGRDQLAWPTAMAVPLPGLATLVAAAAEGCLELLLKNSSMKPRTCRRTASSSGSNQSPPANGDGVTSAADVASVMAWVPSRSSQPEPTPPQPFPTNPATRPRPM